MWAAVLKREGCSSIEAAEYVALLKLVYSPGVSGDFNVGVPPKAALC